MGTNMAAESESFINEERQADAQAERHTTAAFFHVAFKLAALLVYLLGTWFSSSNVVVFVLCIILIAMDFWTVKNVTGRLMVGLRWHQLMNEDGTSKWIFEASQDRAVDPMDKSCFWAASGGIIFVWVLLAVSAFLGMKLSWFLICVFAVTMSCPIFCGSMYCKPHVMQ